MRSWSFKLVGCVKAFLQNRHSNDFSPVWMRSWTFKLDDWEKDFLQNWHLKAPRLCEDGHDISIAEISEMTHCKFCMRSCSCCPVCMRSCCCKFWDVVHIFSQNRHAKVRSPVWIRSWILKPSNRINVFSQYWHMKGRSQLWVSSWFCTVSRFLNVFSQNRHPKSFSFLWMLCSWVFKFPDCVNRFLQNRSRSLESWETAGRRGKHTINKQKKGAKYDYLKSRPTAWIVSVEKAIRRSERRTKTFSQKKSLFALNPSINLLHHTITRN